MGKKTTPQLDRPLNEGKLSRPRFPASSYGPEAIRYLGHKTNKKDTVTDSGTIWEGHNDVQIVPHNVAVKLKQFPSVWVNADKEVAEDAVKANPDTIQTDLKEGLKTEVEVSDPRVGDNSIADFSNLKDAVSSESNDDSYLSRYVVILDLMRDLAEERSQILEARRKRDSGEAINAPALDQPCIANLMRELYGYAAELRHELVEDEGWQDTDENRQVVNNLLAVYLGIDLNDPVDIEDLGAGFSRRDLLELSKRQATGLHVKIHSLAGDYFSDVAAIDMSRGPVSQLPFSSRDICKLDEDEYRAFKTGLSRLMLETFSSKKILDVDDRARDDDVELITFCKREGKTIFDQGSLDIAKEYLEKFKEVRPNCETHNEAYEKLTRRTYRNRKLNERPHAASTIGKFIRELKAANLNLGL